MKSLLITGAGVISPAGVGSAFLPKPEGLNSWGDLNLPDIDPVDYGWKGLNRQSRIGKYSSLAIGEAFRSAGWNVPLIESSLSARTALIVCTSNSNLEPILTLYQEAESYGVNHVNPGVFPDTVMNAIGGHASIYFQITGPNVTLSNGQLSAPMGLLYAYDLLMNGQADQVICCAINIHPPSKLRNIAGGCSGPESIVALMFQRDDGTVLPAAPEKALSFRWGGSHNEVPPGSAYVHPKHFFLAAASLLDARFNHRPSSINQQFVTRQSDGYYQFMLAPPNYPGNGYA